MRDMPFTVGKEFNVVTVSFDPRETPDLAAAKKKTYVASYGRPGAAEGWHFLTGKQDAIDKLTKAVGFRYVYDAKQDQYIHTSGIMVLTPQRQDLPLLLRHSIFPPATCGSGWSRRRPRRSARRPTRSCSIASTTIPRRASTRRTC